MRSPARSPKAGARSPRPFDRHSGTGTRGLPKKGGAGGKGVWGAAADQDGVVFLDKNDPNYDSEDDAPQMAPIAPITIREPPAPPAPAPQPTAAAAAAPPPAKKAPAAAAAPATESGASTPAAAASPTKAAPPA